MREVNHETPSRATGKIPEARRQQELARLRPVRLSPETLAIRVPVFVGPTAEVLFEGRAYSMPPDAANVPGTAFVYEDRLRIVAGRHEAVHRRGKPGDPPASLPEHRAEKLAAVHGARAVLYEKREQLLRLGDDAVALMTALLHHGSHRSNEYVERLYALEVELAEVVLGEVDAADPRVARLFIIDGAKALRSASATCTARGRSFSAARSTRCATSSRTCPRSGTPTCGK